MSSHESLAAAANDRKARLAQLKSLKRKQAPGTDNDETSTDASTALARTDATSEDASEISKYVSGRNFDPVTRNVKLGLDSTPITDKTKTLEYKAAQLALAVREEQEKEDKEGKPLDLFTLQPKKANWDLKRDLAEKMRVLDVQTENAIAKLVRDRVEEQKKEELAIEATANDGGGEVQHVGMKGTELLGALHSKEREDEEERKREAEEDDAS